MKGNSLPLPLAPGLPELQVVVVYRHITQVQTLLAGDIARVPGEVVALAVPNKNLTGYDKGVTRCLLVATRSRRDGILVDCQGYNFARYSCYVPSKQSLDLRDVPVECWVL